MSMKEALPWLIGGLSGLAVPGLGQGAARGMAMAEAFERDDKRDKRYEEAKDYRRGQDTMAAAFRKEQAGGVERRHQESIERSDAGIHLQQANRQEDQELTAEKYAAQIKRDNTRIGVQAENEKYRRLMAEQARTEQLKQTDLMNTYRDIELEMRIDQFGMSEESHAASMERSRNLAEDWQNDKFLDIKQQGEAAAYKKVLQEILKASGSDISLLGMSPESATNIVRLMATSDGKPVSFQVRQLFDNAIKYKAASVDASVTAEDELFYDLLYKVELENIKGLLNLPKDVDVEGILANPQSEEYAELQEHANSMIFHYMGYMKNPNIAAMISPLLAVGPIGLAVAPAAWGKASEMWDDTVGGMIEEGQEAQQMIKSHGDVEAEEFASVRVR